MKFIVSRIVWCVFILLINQTQSVSYAGDIGKKYVIDQEESYIECRIKYSLIGMYKSNFKDFSGYMLFHPREIEKSKVVLNIETASLKSKYSRLDKVVLSKRLLEAEKYPQLTFESKSFKREEDYFLVAGLINIHGIERELEFPFALKKFRYKNKEGEFLVARGRWKIHRKDFEILWSEVWDKGGIVVGNTVTIDWLMKAKLL